MPERCTRRGYIIYMSLYYQGTQMSASRHSVSEDDDSFIHRHQLHHLNYQLGVSLMHIMGLGYSCSASGCLISDADMDRLEPPLLKVE